MGRQILPKRTIASSVPSMNAVHSTLCSLLASLALLFLLPQTPAAADAAAHIQAQSAAAQTGTEPAEAAQAATVQTAPAHGTAPASVSWLELDRGLEYAEISDRGFSLVAVRIDPAEYEFVLCSSGEEGGNPRTLRDWGEKYNLSVAINASMYLPDGTTSTGYMRSGSYINNKRIVQRFGAFFAAQPDDPDLPRATILERDTDIWQELLSHYRVVIQNYRMISSGRRILWSPGGPLYSISAVARDGSGNILFLHSREPVEAYSFAQHLLHLPLDIRTVMYVEGGGQAGIMVRSPRLDKVLHGRNVVDFLVSGNRNILLPNVIGARPLATSSSSGSPRSQGKSCTMPGTPAAQPAAQAEDSGTQDSTSGESAAADTAAQEQ